jgi:predicted Zn-dependent peptidase
MRRLSVFPRKPHVRGLSISEEEDSMNEERRVLMMQAFLPLLLGLILALPLTAGATTFDELADQVQTFTLDNGLKFIVLERHDAPVFSFFTLVNVGAADEETGRTGLAHMFEHMAFKGTTSLGTKDYKAEQKTLDKLEEAYYALRNERLKGYDADSTKLEKLETTFKELQEEASEFVVTNRFGEVVEQAGGRSMNAFTGVDMTGYFYRLPSNKLEFWAILESDRFANPVMREFYTERDVVIEERRRSAESTPTGRLFTEMIGVAFLAHPYRDGVIGHRSDLESFSRTEAEELYSKYYVAGNMTIVLVGDVELGEVKKIAKKHFSKVPSGPIPPPVRTKEPKQLAERRVILVEDAQPVVVVGYHIPSNAHPDWYAYEMLSQILGSGRTSRLYESLVKKDKIATQTFVFSGQPGQKYPNLLGIFALVSEGEDPYEVEKALYEQIDKVIEEGVTEEELNKVRNRIKADFVRQVRGDLGLAIQLAFAESMQGDWRELFRVLDKMAKVTAEDVQRIAKETLTRSNRTVGIIEKPAAEDTAEEASADASAS